MAAKFFIPAVNVLGQGALDEAIGDICTLGFKHALIVTDKPLVSIGLVATLTDKLNQKDIQATIFDGVQPNPTMGNVEAGLALLNKYQCDFVISLGGG
ncbi:MAG: iron-containing alcohol dehydrogenase, partial [Shewanella sp.]